jgi:polar amino acid transport system substrate-binding protein
MSAWLLVSSRLLRGVRVKLVSIGLLLSAPLLAQAVELVLYTEENPPLNFTRDGQTVGFATDVVQALVERSGDAVRIEMAPWTRGYGLVKQQANVGLFSAARTPEREALLQWVGPLLESHTCFYSHAGSGLKIQTLTDAAHAGQLAVPREWYSHEYLLRQGLSNIFTVTTPEKMMRMFAKRRINLLVASDTGLSALLAQQGMTQAQVERQLCFMQHQPSLAFSLQTDAEVVARWQFNLQALKREGIYTRIYKRWFPGRPLPDSLLKVPPTVIN